MKELDFIIVDAALWMADNSDADRSGLWTIVEPNSPYGENGSEMFDCAIRDFSDDEKTYPIKHLGSFETLRKAKEYLNFLRLNGKTYDTLNDVEYINAPSKFEFSLP